MKNPLSEKHQRGRHGNRTRTSGEPRKKEDRAPLGRRCRRKMLAFCCQKQFSSSLDNMRQYGNATQWMAADVAKAASFQKEPAANKPQGFLKRSP